MHSVRRLKRSRSTVEIPMWEKFEVLTGPSQGQRLTKKNNKNSLSVPHIPFNRKTLIETIKSTTFIVMDSQKLFDFSNNKQ